jgi:hypothetical protein
MGFIIAITDDDGDNDKKTRPVGWKHMTDNWWQFVLIGLLLGSVVIGCSYLLYAGLSRARKWYKVGILSILLRTLLTFTVASTISNRAQKCL